MQTLSEILVDMAGSKKPYYVYLLFKPDGTPFYVGKGRSRRIAAHEQETRAYLRGKKWIGMNTLKLKTIAKIMDRNQQVFYEIDSWHDSGPEAGKREIQIVQSYGRRILETGPLTNIRDGGDLQTDESRALLSLKLKDFCNEHPEFVEHLQNKKNEWIRENPEEYEAAKRKRRELLTADNRQLISSTLKEYYRDNPEALHAMSERAKIQFASEESRERARQSCIDNANHEHILRWLEEADPETLADKWRRHSEWLAGWHKTEEGKAKTAEAARKRNAKFRTEKHRRHMAEKTKRFIENNPEADRARREQAAKTFAKTKEVFQRCYRILEAKLVADGKLKGVDPNPLLDSRKLYKWRQRGMVPDYFPLGGRLEDWEACLSRISQNS